MGWATANLLDGPQVNVILADTGGMVVAITLALTIIIWAEKSNQLQIVKRDALNATDLGTQFINAEQGNTVISIPSITLAINERVVVRCPRVVDNQIQASLIW